MQAVAQFEGACLSFRLVHSCWFSHKLIGAPDAVACFKSTKSRAFNKEAVVENKVSTEASSALGDLRKPAGAVVVVEDGFELDESAKLLASQSEAGGKPMAEPPIFDDFDDVRVQGRGKEMRSRRIKTKK